ncbi:DUF6900 domain-containing protein [Endozoicomonas atrinae]|uniref:DUF6900 domain-containing protein n=1 Tax=Endozoicomonas atrinae TaxID=1333660 RepID=UPI0008245D0A|nr:hypothetical protein [Endozoicomonas atrinae]
MNLQEINQKLAFIAASHFDGVDTLESQGRDRLDWHEVHVCDIKQALLAAYMAGKKEGEKNQN